MAPRIRGDVDGSGWGRALGGAGIGRTDLRGGDQRHLLVSNRVANTLSRIDMQTLEVVDTYPAPGGPDCVELSADRKTLMVTSHSQRRVGAFGRDERACRISSQPLSSHGVWTLDHVARR